MKKKTLRTPYDKLIKYARTKNMSVDKFVEMMHTLGFGVSESLYYDSNDKLTKKEADYIEKRYPDIVMLCDGFGKPDIFYDLIAFLTNPLVKDAEGIGMVEKRYFIDLEKYQDLLYIIYDVTTFDLADWSYYLSWLKEVDDTMYMLISDARYSTREEVLFSRGYTFELTEEKLKNALNESYKQYMIAAKEGDPYKSEKFGRLFNEFAKTLTAIGASAQEDEVEEFEFVEHKYPTIDDIEDLKGKDPEKESVDDDVHNRSAN